MTWLCFKITRQPSHSFITSSVPWWFASGTSYEAIESLKKPECFNLFKFLYWATRMLLRAKRATADLWHSILAVLSPCPIGTLLLALKINADTLQACGVPMNNYQGLCSLVAQKCRMSFVTYRWSDQILCCLSYTDLTTYEDSFAEFLRLDAVVKNASEAGKMMSSQPQVKFNTSRDRSKFSTPQSLNTVVGTFCRARRKQRWQCILVFSNFSFTYIYSFIACVNFLASLCSTLWYIKTFNSEMGKLPN